MFSALVVMTTERQDFLLRLSLKLHGLIEIHRVQVKIYLIHEQFTSNVTVPPQKIIFIFNECLIQILSLKFSAFTQFCYKYSPITCPEKKFSHCTGYSSSFPSPSTTIALKVAEKCSTFEVKYKLKFL